MAGTLILQLRDTMSLIKADLGSVCVRARAVWPNSSTPAEPPFISSTRASALESQTRSESISTFPAVLSAEGRVVGLCWAPLKPQGSKGPSSGGTW